MATPVQVTFDCADPELLGTFWAQALGYKQDDPPPGFESWPAFLKAQNIPEAHWNDRNAIIDPDGRGPRIFFQKVPEGKTVKNRVHLDVNAGGPLGTPTEARRERVDAAVDRLVHAGATRVQEYEEHGSGWVVMLDPEGNEFCVQ